ncbi:Metalloprotease LoiP [Pontiella desulfatans]|uniref:Metalloprotease LoiP n=1 Tax=Pontiella desulfatans TaxID=2750659 RepID=A0A6C2U665_PONDE|nr:M48 family metallopeptidase [Pontiella desulfatans]VGO15297.1 Metalloprotease LoiP [Pontiella desulfatans]
MPPNSQSLPYLLGRKTAPLFLKANWVMKSLAGTDSEKIETEFQMGYLLAQIYEEKVECIENNRLSEIAAKLTGRLRNKERNHRFKLDRSNELNACAIPGGFIYISEKLFDCCGEDVDAIAFVLAHEIAHGIHGDANKRFLTKTVINSLLRLRTRGINPAVQQLLGHLVQQGYSREQEFRADRFAVALVKAAGFDPQGGCRLFTLLGKCDEGVASTIGAYFSSHPAMSDRIRRIDKRIEESSPTT